MELISISVFNLVRLDLNLRGLLGIVFSTECCSAFSFILFSQSPLLQQPIVQMNEGVWCFHTVLNRALSKLTVSYVTFLCQLQKAEHCIFYFNKPKSNSFQIRF